MNLNLQLMGVCFLVITLFTMMGVAQANTSSTHAYRMSTDEPLWFVEISATSFRQMMDKVDDADPFLVTMKRLESGFVRLLDDQSDGGSLGFHWHEDDKKSMCRLYRVGISSDSHERQLLMNRHFATIEPKEGSCKDNGRHLLEFVFDVKERAVLSASRIWGLMLPGEMKKLEYIPSFAYVDTVPVSVGMLPIAQKVAVTQSWVPEANWKEWLYGEVNQKELRRYALEWHGIQAGITFDIVKVEEWEEWIKLLPYKVTTTVSLEEWSDVKGYADTPAVSVQEWQDWVYQEQGIGKRLVLTSRWQEIGPLEQRMTIEMGKADMGKATAAARVSENVYGTPAYGILIATICPSGFLEGYTSCILPELDYAVTESVYGKGLKFLRVPFLEVDQ